MFEFFKSVMFLLITCQAPLHHMKINWNELFSLIDNFVTDGMILTSSLFQQ